MAGYTLSLADADILGQALNVDVRQFPFEIPSVGALQRDRQRIARQVFLDLNRRGLMRAGDLDPELTRALRTLSDYAITVGVMGTVESSRAVYARAATNGETGVLAVKSGSSLRLELIRPTALAVSLVGLLPKLPAGPGQSVSITLPGAEEAPNPFGPVRANRNASDQQLRIAASYLNRPRVGTGMFTVTGRDRRIGKELRGGTLTWIDTDEGRYLAVSRPPGEDGQVRSTFSPADGVRLVHQLGEMIESVAPRR